MADIFNMADTWNAGGTTFTAIKMDVTDTASAAASLLLDLLVGGVSQFAVAKNGATQWKASGSVQAYARGRAGSAWSIYNSSDVGLFDVQAAGVTIRNVGAFSFSSGSDVTAAGGDLSLFRDAADTLAQRRGTNAQTSRLYGTYTDASNYRRVALAMTTAGVASLKPEGAGTGASGNVIHISGLPTSNPGPGILWNNAGTPAIGT